MRLAAALSVVAAFSPCQYATAFAPARTSRHHSIHSSAASISTSPAFQPLSTRPTPLASRLSSANNADDTPENPYADPNYPELEFVNYDDPEYQVDQGLDDEFYLSREEENERTLAEIEAMREDRRKRNDEFQFETYHAQVLRGGEVSLGEWTVFQTDTFMGEEVVKGRHPEAKNVPRLLKWDKVLKVVSRGSKKIIDANAEWRVDGERLVHEERLATSDDFPSMMGSGEEEELVWEEEDHIHVSNTFWPEEMASLDFRGEAGCMSVGKAYTICDATPLNVQQSNEESGKHDGPFSEMRTEVGIQENGMRFRIKLDYCSLEEGEGSSSKDGTPPPLHLRTLTVCRETLDGYWPRTSDNGDSKGKDGESPATRRNQEDIEYCLFGPPGAQGGLYDPPPVGSEKRAVENYLLLQFEGGATCLLPHKLDQHEGEDESVWVTSLDWTPGPIRYQVDRKVLSGPKIKGLKTLELSEVRGEDADRWRPKDGGTNMRQ